VQAYFALVTTAFIGITDEMTDLIVEQLVIAFKPRLKIWKELSKLEETADGLLRPLFEVATMDLDLTNPRFMF
jgi:hypothetical protein